jgi:Vitamin K-dependent gamma-carboxylase
MKWWFAPAPAERLAALRIAIGAFAVTYVLARAPELIAIANLHHGTFEAIGVTRILDQPLAPWLAIAIDAATLVLSVLFTLGIAYRYIAPLTALALLWTLTYRNSWGQPFHTENLLVLHVIALACTPAADVWALAPPRIRSLDHYGWPVKLVLAITVATYVIAGTAKLRLAGSAWLDGEQLRNQIALDNARKVLFGARPSFIARPFLDHPSWFTGFAIGTLVVELGAPIALVGGRIGRIWALTAWLFHVGVLALMHIVFPYPLVGVAFLPLLEPEKVPARILGIFRRVRTVRPT